jgi:hypothetical protein
LRDSAGTGDGGMLLTDRDSSIAAPGAIKKSDGDYFEAPFSFLVALLVGRQKWTKCSKEELHD